MLDLDPNVAFAINSGTWGKQHDLSITNTYGTVNKINDKNVPNSTIEDVRAYADGVWPSQAYSIAVNSGLEDAYKDIIPQSNLGLQDYALPASTFTGKGVSSIPVRTIGDASRTLWLAPSGTTTFAVGPTMTKAAGTATTITVPPTAGDYRLYVVDAQGIASAASKSLVRQRWAYVDDKDSALTYSSGWSNWNDAQDFKGSENHTSRAGDYVQYSFTGSGVRYLSMKQPNMGKVDVYIDGTLAQAGIDAYASTVTKQTVLFEKTDLAAGPHTIKVVCTGTKNAASTSTVCALDAFASIHFPPRTRSTRSSTRTAARRSTSRTDRPPPGRTSSSGTTPGRRTSAGGGLPWVTAATRSSTRTAVSCWTSTKRPPRTARPSSSGPTTTVRTSTGPWPPPETATTRSRM